MNAQDTTKRGASEGLGTGCIYNLGINSITLVEKSGTPFEKLAIVQEFIRLWRVGMNVTVRPCECIRHKRCCFGRGLN